MSKKKKEQNEYDAATMSALLKEKPRRGRPPRKVSRQNVYVALRPGEKELINEMAGRLPAGLARADLADLAVTILNAHLEALRRAVAGRNREIPEGVTDMESLYLLWDLPLPPRQAEDRWTSVRVSPQQVIELGRVHGALNAAFGASRSETFSLGLVLLDRYLRAGDFEDSEITLDEMRRNIQEASN
ncbi:MAG: hypothetical protein ACK2U5_19335 [Candidatus Promineifilaceae bacterium]|jgi:hypothetical protein